MRIDMLLNKLCLVKTRSIAKKAADKGLIELNDSQAKASANVSDGDKIRYQIYGYDTILQIKEVPKGNVAKKDAPEYYEIISRTKLDLE